MIDLDLLAEHARTIASDLAGQPARILGPTLGLRGVVVAVEAGPWCRTAEGPSTLVALQRLVEELDRETQSARV